jgi:hypothetical protein
MVVIPSPGEAEIGRIWFEATKTLESSPISTKSTLGMVVHTCTPTYMGSMDRKISVQGLP